MLEMSLQNTLAEESIMNDITKDPGWEEFSKRAHDMIPAKEEVRVILNDSGSCYHLWDNEDVEGGMFKIMRCLRCGAIDPCGIPEDYWYLFLGSKEEQQQEK
jgi:hypothetical protein